MSQHDDYLSGPHHFWIHFWCGLLVGLGIGAYLGWEFFASGPALFITMGVVALLVAYSSGRWGDRFWHWLLAYRPWE